MKPREHNMKILVACEESQAVTKEFRKLGHEAFSCDILESSGGYPEWHIQGDAVKEAYSGKYDMMLCFTPCTHLAVSGARWFPEKIADGRQKQGVDLFMNFANAPIDKIVIENHNMPSGKRMEMWMYKVRCLDAKSGARAKAASKTFPGIARAMAEQWGK